jgi:TonB-dependent starch-binding outer membrane protein SusC
MIKHLLLRMLALLLCLAFFSPLFSQTRRITGTVVDDKGSPLSGATVSVKNTTVSTSTNAAGAFTINVPANGRTLVISFVGMQLNEVPIGSGNNISIKLQPSSTTLNDVVVVGYGSARRANLTSAQTSVSAKEIERTVNTTVEQALQGRAAGVYVTQNSGQPGGGISVNIRGVSSLNGTQPLYVIDGVQIQSGSDVSFGTSSSTNPLAGLNPNDIEDMQILQGPSATAIYGSRGTNGVVLITTKRGKAGEIKINYTYQYNLQTPPKHLPVMNLQQYAQMVKEYHVIAGGTTPGEFLDPSLLGAGTDWQRELFNNAPMNKHQLNLSGGSNNTTYYMSGEYLDQQGIAAGSGFKRYSFRLNLDNKPREWATIGANLSFNQTNENLATTNYGDAASPLIANALRLTPQIPVVNLNGSWGSSDPVNGAGQYAPTNPIALASLITNKNMRRQFLGGLNVAITPAKGLTIRSSFNATIGSGMATYYSPTYELDQWHFNKIASLANATYQSWYWNWNELAEYTRQFGKHNVSAMVSHESQASEYQALSAGRSGFLTNDIFDVNAGDAKTATNGGGTYPWAQESYLGRVNYNYDNRYLLTGTYRRDGSPYFGPEKRWGSFPSVSGAWRISREKFFQIPAISELKLRYEYGFTGNQGSSNAAIYATLNNYATTWGTGFLPSTFTNPLFQWEDTKTKNYGLNLGLLKNRITVEADYYIKNTKNLILNAVLPWYMGTSGVGSVSPPLVNAGSLQTKGWNLTFNTTNIQNKNFKWESNLNISHFKTIVDQLYQSTPFISRTSWWMNNWTQRAVVGQQPWVFMGYLEDGLFKSTDEIAKSAVPVDAAGNRVVTNAQTGLWVGDVKYKDINGDGKIDQNDLTIIGNPWPKLTGGFTNSFSFKGFDLSILITGAYGNDVYNYIAAEASNPNNINLSRNLMVKAMDYAKVTTDANGKAVLANPETRVPRISNNQISSDNNFGRITDRFLEDGSYLRLKNVSLSYNIPAKVVGYAKVIKGLRATIGVQNLATLTHYTGYDPEVGAYIGTGAQSNNQASGIDFGRYPITPMYSTTLSVNF